MYSYHVKPLLLTSWLTNAECSLHRSDSPYLSSSISAATGPHSSEEAENEVNPTFQSPAGDRALAQMMLV